MTRKLRRLVVAAALALGVAAPLACHTNDAYTNCRAALETGYDNRPILTRYYLFSTDGRTFCKAAIQDHNHYHCAHVDADTHAVVRGWSYCPDDTAGPSW